MSEHSTTEAPELNADAGIAAAATAESAEILNLLNDEQSGGSCCGGSCCAAMPRQDAGSIISARGCRWARPAAKG